MKRKPLPICKEEHSKRPKEWSLYGLVAAVGVLTYANSLRGEFVHDDIPAIVTNKDVLGLNPVLEVFKNDFWGTPMSDPHSHKSYRPLTTLTFRLNHSMCGLRVMWWHTVNISLHAISCVLVTRVAARVARLHTTFATLAGLLFAVHPIHTEAVSGVVGRADVLACVFFLTSILLYHGSSSGKHRVWASATSAVLGTFAKESALTALLVNIVWDVHRTWSSARRCQQSTRTIWWQRGGIDRRLLHTITVLTVLVSVRLALLYGSLPAFSPQDNPSAFHPSFTVRLMTFWHLAALNWWMVLCPCTLSHDWQMGSIPLITSPLDPRNILTIIAVFSLLALIYRCYMDLDSQRSSPVSAGLLLLTAPYLPASNLFVTVGFVLAERVLYMPSVGSVILTAYGVQVFCRRVAGRWRPLVVGAVLLLAASGSARTLLRNRDWRTKETLLRADLAVLPHNAKLHYNFANFLKDVEQQDSAIKHYEEALRLWPSYASAHNNLGTLVVATGRAEHHFLQALKYNRDHVNAHYNLGKLYRKKNRVSEARRMLERCASLEPRSTVARLELLLVTPASLQRPLLLELMMLESSRPDYRLLYAHWQRQRGQKVIALMYYLETVRISLRGSQGAPARGSRVELAAVSAACRLLRDMGQRARILHLLTRWRSARGAGSGATLLLRRWRLRSELQGRALLYSQRAYYKETSTCLHHTQLEVSEDPYHTRVDEDQTNSNPSDYDVKHNTKTEGDGRSQSRHSEHKTDPIYKHIHNNSYTNHKQSCALHKKKDSGITLISDNFIKTY